MIKQLQVSDETIKTKFPLTEGILAEAEAEKKDIVYLWLGANTLVEYSFNEAEVLLDKNLINAKKDSETYRLDLEFIRDQLTILEVNYARVHNYKVALNQKTPQTA